mgnify:CR=1 FL=1
MKNIIHFIFLIIIIFLIQSVNLKAEKIVYINMERIMKESKAGKKIVNKINETNQVNIKKFKKIEENLKKTEQDLVTKKNVLSEEEFQNKFNELKKNIDEYRTIRQNTIQDTTKKRISASAEFSNKIKPILGDYASKNDISIIFQKKNIIMGKSSLDITEEILKIVDKEISKIKF